MAIHTNLFKIPLSPAKTCQLAWLCPTASSRPVEEALQSVGLDSQQSWGLSGKQTGERPSLLSPLDLAAHGAALPLTECRASKIQMRCLGSILES